MLPLGLTPATKPVILVTGATGPQGGSVARHLLARGHVSVRALVRNIRTPAARALADAGATLVVGDLGDAEAVHRAMAGVWGLFGVTDWWEHFDAEYRHGVHLVEAARDAGVKHVVLSTQHGVQGPSDYALRARHHDLKAEIESYARVQRLPATFVHVAFGFEELFSLVPPMRDGHGQTVFRFPLGEAPLPLVALDDVGGVVATIFEQYEPFIGRTVPIVGEVQPMQELVAIMTAMLRVPVVYEHESRERFARREQLGASDLADMFHFLRTRAVDRQDALEASRLLYPALRDFPTWLAERSAVIRTVMALRGAAA